MIDAPNTERADKNEAELPAAELDGRRDFLKKATLGLAAGLGATAVCPFLAPIVTPLTREVIALKGTEIDAGLLKSFNATPRKVVVAVTRIDAWTQRKKEVVGAVYVRRVGETLSAFSSICPHASCSVSFDSAHSQYVCPCHNTYFKMTGEITAGPSHRGLDSLPIRVENDRVYITYKSFRPGIAGKEEV
jgi:menaquinol-cytochrome c reductase iron-sulfur subunit